MNKGEAKRGMCLLLLLAAGLQGCGGTPPPDPRVHELGTVELTARLDDITGDFPSNDLYDYAYVMRYTVLEVHRGEVQDDTIFVGHYNPLKPRATVADQRSGEIGGNVTRWRVGDVHRMALEAPIDDQFMGGIINEYFVEGQPQLIYWAWWTDRAGD
jgi:hypothetical protein